MDARFVRLGIYCAVRILGDTPTATAQSEGEPDEGRQPAPLGRVPAPQAGVRGEGRALAVRCFFHCLFSRFLSSVLPDRAFRK